MLNRGQDLIQHSALSLQHCHLLSALSRIRTCNNGILGPAPLPVLGYQSIKWTPEGIEPSFPGCKPGVFPLDDGPIVFFMLREGFEPSAPAFGGPCSDPVELPQR